MLQILFATEIMVSIDCTMHSELIEHWHHLLTLGEGAHCKQTRCNFDENIYTDNLLMLGAKMSPENRMRGLSFFVTVLTAVRNLYKNIVLIGQ